MTRKANFIAPLFRDQVKERGMYIFRSAAADPVWPPNIAHRDENYLFILQKKGRSRLMLDFKTFEMAGPSVFFILPGQIHHPVESDTELYVLVVEPSLVQTT